MSEISFEKGMNLRLARHLLPPGSLLNATNLAPDELGGLRTRKGMTLINAIANQDLNSYYVLHGFGGGPDHSYQGVTQTSSQAFSLYRDFTTLLFGPSGSGGYIDFADMREFQSDRQWVFFAGGQVGLRFKDDGTFTYKWGIAAPPTAPTLAAGAAGQPNGTYTYRYIFVRHDLSGVIPVAWGNPSPESAPITVTNQQVSVSGIINPQTAGPNQDLQITHAYIFRNRASQPGVWLLVGNILPVITDTFVDNLNDLDLPLVSGLPSGVLQFDNGLPPVFSSITVHQDRLWGVTGADNRLWYSQIGRPEQFSALGYLELGPLSDTAIVVKAFDGRLYVGTDSRFIPILGTDELSYRPDDTPVPVGVTSPFSLAQGLRGLYWRGPDGVYRWNGSTATNITEHDLYPIFHRSDAHGFTQAAYAVHPFGPQYFSAGGWFEGRYYLTYATGATAPYGTQTLVYDELTETWYADSRAFRRYFYSRQLQTLIGTALTGHAFRVQDGTTDVGTAIPWTFQSRDVHEGEEQSDNALQELTLDIDTSNTPTTLTIIKDYGASSSAPISILSNGRTQQITAMGLDTIMGTALGYRLTGVGVVRLYRLMPRVTAFPGTRLAFDTLPLDLGYPGPKLITGLTLDVSLLEPGTITPTVLGDQVVRPTLTQSTVGRTQENILPQSFEATIVQASIRSTGRFRMYPSTSFAWIPLPRSTFQDAVSGSDLGHVGEKRIVGVFLDTEMLAPGTVSPTLIVDGVEVPLLPQQVSGRQLLNLLTQDIDGSIIGLRVSSTAPFRRWSGSYIAWLPLPAAYFDYHWPSSSFGTANEKVFQAVNLDIEPMSSAGATFLVVVNGTLPFTFPLLGGGRRVTGRLRFPRTAHGHSIEYRLSSSGRWRLWGGELLFQVLGSAGLQRMAITTPGGTVGPDVQKSSLDQTVLGPHPQATTLNSSAA